MRCIAPETALLALVAAILIAAPDAPAADERADAWRRPASKNVPPPAMTIETDRVRPALPGVVAPTDPRDGTRDPFAHSDPEALALARRLGETNAAGGDDVHFGALDYLDKVKMDVATNGDLYLGVGRNPSEPFGESVQVYRSTDDGESWTLIGTFSSSGNEYDRLYTIDVVEGTTDRVFVTYMHYNSSRSAFDVRVSFAPLGTDTPAWTTRTVMNTPGVSFLGPDMAEDSIGFSTYYLYMVCAGLDGNGDDIFYCRSTDQGETWSTPYRIDELTSSGNLMYSIPRIEYGVGGDLHVAYVYTERLQSTFDDGLVYRKATNWGSSASDWSTLSWGLEPINDGADVFTKDITTSPDGSVVSVLATGYNSGSPRIRNSDTAGASWSLSRVTDVSLSAATSLAWDPTGSRLLVGGATSVDGTGPTRAAYAQASASDVQTFGTATVLGDVYPQYGRAEVLVHPALSPDVMLGYTASLGGGNYSVGFDGEWRGGAGYPNYEDGFPLNIPTESVGYARTNPAVVDLDGDSDLEIVFANTDGNVHAYHHDGSVVSGWPVDVGNVPYGSPVAIGDLSGGGIPTVVVGDTVGNVHAFAPNGEPRDGFPVSMGTGAPVYLAIGALGPPYPRWILAVSGSEQARINWRGRREFKSGTLNGTHETPPVIGDVDGDGDMEVAYTFRIASGDAGVQVLNADFSGGVQAYRGFPEAASAPLSLGDVDLDGDLEITVPLANGDLYVVHHDLSDVANFPFSSSSASPLTRVAIDQFLGTFEPELVFAARDWNVHVVYHDGVEQSNYPATTDNGWFHFRGPILTSVDSDSGNYVVTGSRGSKLWAFRNVGASVPPAWPKFVGDQIEMTPAAGDIDLDGRNEIVFLGNQSLHVIDVGVANGGNRESWPMDGANPARTGCSECDENLATSVESAPEDAGVSFRIASGNPARGFAEFAFALDRPGVAELSIFDARGRLVRRLGRAERGAGAYRLVFDGRDAQGASLARGAYFARLDVDRGRERVTRKFTWLD